MKKSLPKKSIGLGLRTEHYGHVEENLDSIDLDWFEVISENHMNSKGRPIEILDIVSQKIPLSLHGVSLSIASHEELNFEYLNKLKNLRDKYNPIIISDHLCWTGIKKSNLHNLLPFAYNQENLIHLCNRIDKVQNYLKQEIALENLSAYFNYKASAMAEWEFIKKLLDKSGCKLLLDVNNVYVNSVNHQFDAKEYINNIPSNKISYIHLAGFSDCEDFLFDTHSKPVYPEVWDLYEYTIKSKGSKPTLIEWDEDIPEFSVLLKEAHKARTIMERISDEV
ncbi:MAG: DUF692 domain-containing protein [Bacteriovoracaceae bacterium]|jgi:uncharacterized protein|nr:DUF692 domain-containing protein [Bacteriovoracaceae bacterium]